MQISGQPKRDFKGLKPITREQSSWYMWQVRDNAKSGIMNELKRLILRQKPSDLAMKYCIYLYIFALFCHNTLGTWHLGNMVTHTVLPWVTVIIQKYMTIEQPRMNYSREPTSNWNVHIYTEINFPYRKVFAQMIHYPLILLLVDVDTVKMAK